MHVSLNLPLRRCAAVIAAGCALLAGPLSAASLVRLVGPQAPFTFVVADAPALIAKWETSPFARTWADEEVRRFFAPLHTKLAESEWQKKVQEATGRTPAELLGLLKGEVLFSIPDSAWIVPGDEAPQPRLLFAAQIGDNQAEIERLIGLLVEHDLVESSTRDVGGRSVQVLREKEKPAEETATEGDAAPEAATDEAAPATPDESTDSEDALVDEALAANPDPIEEVMWTIVDGTLLIAPHEDTLVHAFRVLGGESLPSLTDSDDFAVTQKRAADSDVLLHVDLTWIHPLAMAAAEKEGANGEPNAMGMQPAALVAALGLDTLRSVYLGARIGEGRTETHGGLRYSEKKGLTKLLAFAPGPVERPAFVPAQWLSAGVFKFSLPEMYRGIFELLDAANPMIAGMAQGQIRNWNRQLGVDLETDLIGSFGDVVVSAVTVPPGGVTNLPPGAVPIQQVVGVSLSNAAALTRAVAALRTMAGPAAEQIFRERDYLGTTIVEIVTPTAPAPSGDAADSPPPPAAPQIAYAITESWFLFSTGGTAPIEAAIQGQQQKAASFWDRAEVKKILADAPADAAGVQYEDTRRTIGAMLPIFVQLFSQMSAATGGEELPIDPMAVPSPETVAKYWGEAAGFMTVEPDGLHSSGVVTYPAP